MHARYTNYLLFFLLPTLWGGSFIGIKIAIDGQPPVFAAATRTVISLITLWLLFRLLRKNTFIPWQTRWPIWTVGIFALGIPYTLLFWGERSTTPALAGILNGTVPIWTYILSFFITDLAQVRCFKRKLVGLILGVFGIMIIFLPALHFKGSNFNVIGPLAILGMALSYSVASILNQYLLQTKNVNFCANIYHQHWSGLLFLLIISALFEPWPSLNYLIANPHLLWANAYLGIVSTAIAWMIFYHLIRTWGAMRTSITAYLIPISAMLWDWLFFANRPEPNEFIGVLVILCGVLLVQYEGSFNLKHITQLKPIE